MLDLKNIPKQPGVYQYFDKNGKIIYIGKSLNLHSRVNSYFNSKNKLNFAKKKMVSQITNIETIVTNTAIESLLLETNLIKKHKPKYNILMKDDKNHTYIKITDEIIPKIIKTRSKTPHPLTPSPSKERENLNSPLLQRRGAGGEGGVYFGPYISTTYVNNLIKITKKIFGHRSCNIVFEKNNPPIHSSSSPLLRGTQGDKSNISIKSTNGSKIPCMDYYIGRCAGPCLLKEENIENYKKSIENIKNFFEGNYEEVIINLQTKMQKFAEKLEFEEAKKIKDDILAIKSLDQNQIITNISTGTSDIINFLEKYDKIYVSKIEVRNNKITGIYNFELNDKLADLNAAIRFFIEQNYIENKTKLNLILPKDIDFEEEIIKELNLKIEIPKIGEKTEILTLAYKNAFEFAYKKHLEGLSVKGFTKKDMSELLTLLGYKQINKNMVFECNDISHISGNHTVASRSVIENGKTANSKYRKYKIKTLEQGKIDDFSSLKEVITRRLAEIQKTGIIPDLIIIDGGKGQLSSVMDIVNDFQNKSPHPLTPSPSEEMENLNYPLLQRRGAGGDGKINLQLISLAKKDEEIFLPGKSEPIILDKDSNILRMIQKIRDEAHRFAITFNRDSRIKSNKKNILEELPGIGPKTRAKLLKHYGNIDNIENDEELKNILSKTQIETLQTHGII